MLRASVRLFVRASVSSSVRVSVRAFVRACELRVCSMRALASARGCACGCVHMIVLHAFYVVYKQSTMLALCHNYTSKINRAYSSP